MELRKAKPAIQFTFNSHLIRDLIRKFIHSKTIQKHAKTIRQLDKRILTSERLGHIIVLASQNVSYDAG